MKLLYLWVVCVLAGFSISAQPVKVMLITGGHSFDSISFFTMFNSLKGIEYRHYTQPGANHALAGGVAENFDVLVFYDMWKSISKEEQEAYVSLTHKGKPFLFLHHALVSYQQWPEFEQILGGRYIENPELTEEQQSTYQHDVWVVVQVADPRHPVTRNMNNFRIFDEVYGNFIVLPGVQPLLKTAHPQSHPVIGWENRYNSSSIIYLQPGHDKNAYISENYRKLILQAIKYLAGKT